MENRITNKNTERTEKQPYLSVVIPFYNEVENVERVWTILSQVLDETGKSYEVIFVDDGSDDGTRETLRKLAAANAFLKVILFRANFGQSAAMAAGFKMTKGQIVVAMDGDLQNDPKDIPLILSKLEEGYDVVSGWRKNRKDKLIVRKVPSRIANRIICSVTNVKLHDTGCSLKAFRGDLLRKISLYGELHRFIPALLRMEGAKIAEIPVRHHARKFGKSKYNLSRTFRVIMDLTTIRLLMKHIHNPLRFFAHFSAFCFWAGVLVLANAFYQLFWIKVDVAELNIPITLILLLWAMAFQFLCYGLVGKLVVNTGSRKKFEY
ncbi:glycosyltransferase family 2 protein [candidate division KSB1 bacterium]|nr:glycosyltransferase family 2 protein [candidate division KSB1 bacterium]